MEHAQPAPLDEEPSQDGGVRSLSLRLPSGPPQVLSASEFEELAMAEMESAGGPAVYLRSHFPASAPEGRKALAEAIGNMLPCREDLVYFTRKLIPVAPEDHVPGQGIHIVELVALGFDCACSLKPAVSLKRAQQLLAEYMLDGQ